jgi:predicted XRE-type DNA-binding protein
LHAFEKKTQRTSQRDIEIAKARFRNDEGSNMTRAKVYASVWDPLADTPEQAAHLRARAELMQQIAAIVKKNRWTQTEAAQRCGITQPRMNDLLRGRVSRFSLDALVNIATAIGRRVHMELESV